MNLLFEESGEFKSGTVLSQAGESYQVEMPGGKRNKVRAKDVLLEFTAFDPAVLMQEAKRIAQEIDLDFIWEVAGTEEFTFTELGEDYFGRTPRPDEAAGLLLRLHGAPMYFYRKGKGRYKAAPEESLKAALAGIEKKKQQALVQQAYVDELKSGAFPESMKPLAIQLLCKPDKNSIAYKALNEACTEMQITPERLMVETGAIASAHELHLNRFLYEHFPRGRFFPSYELQKALPDLPLADVRAFSIDDATTVEIDDAFSVTFLNDGLARIGIHIAAPALCMRPDDRMDGLARERMSTVYMPGDKITMLPDDYISLFTLAVGAKRPAVSLYAIINLDKNELLETQTCLEAIEVVSNLRHNDLESLVTEESLANNEGDYPHKAEIAVLWGWIQTLTRARMEGRETFGLRPEQANRPDYHFYIDGDSVRIEQRQRTAPLDRIVAELMIFANSTWGAYLKDHAVPGIYRSQGEATGSWARRQVKMQAHAAPHHGLGVNQYIWSTSPLRRYVDLVNQWQILACIQHGVAAPLSAPFKNKDASLFAIISAFDSAYTAYSDFQARMERYWCLRWLEQEAIRQADAVVVRDELVRLVSIPLTIPLVAARQLASGTGVTLEILRWDEIDLSVEARLLEKSAEAVSPPLDEGSEES